MTLKKVTEKNCKEVCLKLWEQLSKKDYKVKSSPPWVNLKVQAGRDIGYDVSTCNSACPLCQFYRGTKKCPYGDCSAGNNPCIRLDEPCDIWSNYVTRSKKNNKDLAKELYTLLKKKMKVKK